MKIGRESIILLDKMMCQESLKYTSSERTIIDLCPQICLSRTADCGCSACLYGSNRGIRVDADQSQRMLFYKFCIDLFIF